MCGVKVWYHVFAGFVGFALAAVIVYLVFGSASEQGATQDGAAPAQLGASGGVLCGTITPAEATTPAARKRAAGNLPALFDEKGPIAAIRDDQPDQKAWLARVHAASGGCMDEIKLEPDRATLEMSTVDGISDADADAFAAGAIAQAFTAPLGRPVLDLTASVHGETRTAHISRRAWNAYQVSRRQLGVEHSMKSLADFRRARGFSRADLRVTGWD